MRAREGLGAVSLLAVVCSVWAFGGLLETGGSPSAVSGEASPSLAGPRGPIAPRAAMSSRSGWDRSRVLAGAIAISAFPAPDLHRLRGIAAAPEAPEVRSLPSGWPRASSFVRTRSVPELPTALILALAGAFWFARRAFAGPLARVERLP